MEKVKTLTKHSTPTKRIRRKESQKTQSERFIEAAREHESDIDEAKFDETLRKTFKQKSTGKR